MEDPELLAAATAAADRAHAPYSGYRVGAALLGASGRVYPAGNVENASYGLSICAERAAVCVALAAGEREFRAIAVVAPGSGRECLPCGACRQVLAEFCAMDLEVLALDPQAGVRRRTLGQLLPEAFGLS